MSCTPTPHVGQVNFAVTVQLIEEDENGVESVIDVSAATSKKIYLTSPLNVTTEHNADFRTDGTDGKITMLTVAGTLSLEGVWRVVGWVDLGADEFEGEESTFEVRPSRRSLYQASL